MSEEKEGRVCPGPTYCQWCHKSQMAGATIALRCLTETIFDADQAPAEAMIDAIEYILRVSAEMYPSPVTPRARDELLVLAGRWAIRQYRGETPR
jgi:hypothetical protein